MDNDQSCRVSPDSEKKRKKRRKKKNKKNSNNNSTSGTSNGNNDMAAVVSGSGGRGTGGVQQQQQAQRQEKQQVQSQEQQDGWYCNHCTYFNSYECEICLMCYEPYFDTLQATLLQQQQDSQQQQRQQQGSQKMSNDMLSFDYGGSSMRRNLSDTSAASNTSNNGNYNYGQEVYDDYEYYDTNASQYDRFDVDFGSKGSLRYPKSFHKYLNYEKRRNNANYKSQINGKKSKSSNHHTNTTEFLARSSYVFDDWMKNEISQIVGCALNVGKFVLDNWDHLMRVRCKTFDDSKFRCPICLSEKIEFGRITKCGHVFCGHCLLHYLCVGLVQHVGENGSSNENNTTRENNRSSSARMDATATTSATSTNDNCTTSPKFGGIDDQLASIDLNQLIGTCPLCQSVINFGQCRPASVIRQKKYKIGERLDLVSIARSKGSQPRLRLPSREASADEKKEGKEEKEEKEGKEGEVRKKQSVSEQARLFVQFETVDDCDEIERLQNELSLIEVLLESSKDKRNMIDGHFIECDPTYDGPYLRLLKRNIEEYVEFAIKDQMDAANNASKNSKTQARKQKNMKTPQKQTSKQEKEKEKEREESQSDENNGQKRKQKSPKLHKGTKLVFQCEDGQFMFLHPLCYNMLCFEFEDNRDSMPLILKDRVILEIESFLQSFDNKRKYKFLSWIPLYCEFSFVEIDLTDIVSIKTINHFKNELSQREYERRQYIQAQMEQKQRDLEKEYNRVENIKAMYNHLHEYNNYNPNYYYDSNNLGTFEQNFPMLGNNDIDTIGTGTDSSKDGSPKEDKNKQVKKGFASIVSKGAANRSSTKRKKRKAKAINIVPVQAKNTNNGAKNSPNTSGSSGNGKNNNNNNKSKSNGQVNVNANGVLDLSGGKNRRQTRRRGAKLKKHEHHNGGISNSK